MARLITLASLGLVLPAVKFTSSSNGLKANLPVDDVHLSPKIVVLFPDIAQIRQCHGTNGTLRGDLEPILDPLPPLSTMNTFQSCQDCSRERHVLH